MREIVRFVLGSLVVYAVVAACSVGDAGKGKQPTQITGPAIAGSPGGAVAGHGSGGTSGSAGGPMDSIMDAIVDPVPSAVAEPPQSGSRLRAIYVVGSDGSREFRGWHDAQRNEDCSFTNASDGSMRCMPVAGGSGGLYYSDASCTVPIFLIPPASNCGGRPSSKYGSAVKGCGFELFALTPAATPAIMYLLIDGTCTMTAVPAGYAFATGTPIAASEFVQANIEVE